MKDIFIHFLIFYTILQQAAGRQAIKETGNQDDRQAERQAGRREIGRQASIRFDFSSKNSLG